MKISCRCESRFPRAALLYPSLTALACAMIALTGDARADDPFERAPINYMTAEVHDPIQQLQQQIASGEVQLDYEPKLGYLRSVLDRLGIATSSQALVFSKTSFQQRQISPKSPRALYFNDTTYVGYVQGGDVLEFSAVDPQQGAVFYTLEQKEIDRPQFTRQTHQCLQCHASAMTEGVPGHLVRSIFPDDSGFPILRAGTFRTTHGSPLKERWGGWYVSGTHGRQTHMGNATLATKDDPEQLDLAKGANVTDLSEFFDTSAYATPHSDIVALMVLEHQTQMHNLITRANHETRRALHDATVLNRMLNRPPDFLSPSTRRRIENAAEPLVKYMLFEGEARLSDPVQGTSAYGEEFVAIGPRDRQGRSLREFDLKTRLFKYPCSFLIYSDAFDGLPVKAKDHVYRRLWEVLSADEAEEAFAHLTEADRRAIIEILRETKPGLPDYWQQDS